MRFIFYYMYYRAFSEIPSSGGAAPTLYSYLSNKRGGWNKRGGGAKNAKSLNVEGVIDIIF